MSTYDRMERKIERLERHIDKHKQKMNELHQKHQNHEISERKYCSKKNHIQSKIRDLDAQVRILKGGLVKQKHHLKDSAE
jgi:chromosome segregation ATPase